MSDLSDGESALITHMINTPTEDRLVDAAALKARVAQLKRTIQWAADRLRHDGNKEAVVVEVIDQLNKAVQ